MNFMNRLMTLVLFMGISVSVMADGAMPGIWKTKRLNDGREVSVELKGDEHMCFWQSADGSKYVERGGVLQPITTVELDSVAQSRRARVLQDVSVSEARRGRSAAMFGRPAITGSKKGLIILVEFADKSFSEARPQQYFNRMANEKGFDNGFNQGSISDYFRDQSNGLFELTFDVVGPVRVSKGYAYYGKDSDTSIDDNVGEMLVEAINKADGQVNWADYDWDGDGEVEQIFFLYAGEGQATGGGDDTIWPHQFYLRGWNTEQKPVIKNGIVIDGYACTNEVNYYGRTTGIGTFCHEFSHCLGLPDVYDTSANDGNKSPNYGMDSWDLMDRGNHNNGGYTPCGYTCWEKMALGWIEPVELTTDVMVTGMKPTSEGGDAYVIYNQGNRNEYYLLENRVKRGWDKSVDGSGLMVMHVDYDETVFAYNLVNTFMDGYNDHQRMTIFHADNKANNKDNKDDPYPYGGMNVLSNYSVPAAKVYNENADGSKNMNIRLSRIAKGNMGDISFLFGDLRKVDKSLVFVESFDDCSGMGGNDGSWATNVFTGNGTFRPDNEKWIADYMKGARYCARFGNAAPTDIRSPKIIFSGDCKLTLRVAPFAAEGSMTVALSTDNPNVVLADKNISLSSMKWTEFTTTVSGKGEASIILSPSCRLYIDDMQVKDNNLTPIHDMMATPEVTDGVIYDMQGRRTGSNGNRHGIFIMDGRKVVR